MAFTLTLLLELCLLMLVVAKESARFLGAYPPELQENSTANSTATGTIPGKACFSVPGCRGLGGDCCPAPDGMYLACCSAPVASADPKTLPAEPSTQPSVQSSAVPTVPPTLSSELWDFPPASAIVPGAKALPMEPFCDHANVGYPNCGNAARCAGEYHVNGSSRILRATSEACAYVTFKTGLSLKDVLQLDAEVFISAHTCNKLDNMAFWFFQTVEQGDAWLQPTQHWDAVSEVDLVETYIGPGNVNSINTNFAATGLHRQWPNLTIEGGMHQHVTMWQDADGAGCPSTRKSGYMGDLRTLDYGTPLPVVSVYVAHCAPGAPCCQGEGCKKLQKDPNTASVCITAKKCADPTRSE
jgi:hypothetical protein